MLPKLTIEDVKIRQLKDGYDLSEFKCEKRRFEKHLRVEAPKDELARIGKVYLFIDKENEKVIGFVTLAMGSLPRDFHENLAGVTRFGDIPSLLLGQMARDVGYKGRGVGDIMLTWVIGRAMELSVMIGCRLVILHSDPDKIETYKAFRFELVPPDRNSKNTMFLDLKPRKS